MNTGIIPHVRQNKAVAMPSIGNFYITAGHYWPTSETPFKWPFRWLADRCSRLYIDWVRETAKTHDKLGDTNADLIYTGRIHI